MTPGGCDFPRGAVRIRLAQASDLHAILEAEQSAAEAFLATEHADAPDPPPADLAAYRGLIEAGTAWVAEEEGALLGSAVAELAPDALHLFELAVRLSHQRRGLGRRLVEATAAGARARGAAAVTLTTFRSVKFNAPFYQTLGFVILESPTPRLAAILKAEAAWGLRDRCAMRLALRRDR